MNTIYNSFVFTKRMRINIPSFKLYLPGFLFDFGFTLKFFGISCVPGTMRGWLEN